MNNTKRFVAIIGIGLAVIMPISRVFAQSFEQFEARYSVTPFRISESSPKRVNKRENNDPSVLEEAEMEQVERLI
jgi:hypothetical protein